MNKLIPLALASMCAVCAAESRLGEQGSAAAHLNVRIVVPPVFRVLQVTPMGAEDEVRVWTNMKTVVFNRVQYHFDRLGENVLRIPRANDRDVWRVHGL